MLSYSPCSKNCLVKAAGTGSLGFSIHLRAFIGELEAIYKESFKNKIYSSCSESVESRFSLFSFSWFFKMDFLIGPRCY